LFTFVHHFPKRLSDLRKFNGRNGRQVRESTSRGDGDFGVAI
jgi:hypothetical protein